MRSFLDRSVSLVAAPLLAAGILVAGATIAQAGPTPCSVTYVTAEGSNALQCEDGGGNNDAPHPDTVNDQTIFDHDDWVFLAKEAEGELEGEDIGLVVTGLGGLSGTWTVDPGTFSGYEEFMIVLKAGNTWAAFLFDNTAADNGTWGYPSSPGLSHLSVYARGEGDTQVPEPMTLALLGAGVLGLGFARRRRS